MFILNENEDILVNVDNITDLYIDSIFVKVSCVNGKEVLLETCSTFEEAKEEIHQIKRRLENGSYDNVINLKRWSNT